MTTISNPVLRGFNPDPSILRVGDDIYIATSTFEWYPGVQIHQSRDLVHWRLASRPLSRATQLDMRGDPDSCGIWAPDLTHADGRFWLVYTDVKRYGMTTVNGAKGLPLRDFPNFLVTAPTIEGPWSDPVHLNSSGFDPALFHDEDGRSWLLNVRWDHRPGRGRFAGIELQELDRETLCLVGEPQLIYTGTDRGFTEGPHLYRRDGWYHLLVAEGGTGWDHAVVMARARTIAGPYETHPDGAVLSADGARDGALARAGHGDLVTLADGSPWLAYLCGRPLPGLERCVLGRETALQPMRWDADGWLRTLSGNGLPDPAPAAPDLPKQAWPAGPLDDGMWDGRFTSAILPPAFQWLRTPHADRLFSLSARPGHLRLYGRETVGSQFEQALVARRQTHHAWTAETLLDFDPRSFQQAAGLICYYNSTKFHYLLVSEEDGARVLQVMSASPEDPDGTSLTTVAMLPVGPIALRAECDGPVLRFSWRAQAQETWQKVDCLCDASVLSDEVTRPGLPNFTGSFVGMACQDLSGRGTPADFAWFHYAGADDTA